MQIKFTELQDLASVFPISIFFNLTIVRIDLLYSITEHQCGSKWNLEMGADRRACLTLPPPHSASI